MKLPGQHFLSDPGLALKQDRYLRRTDLPEEEIQFLGPRAGYDACLLGALNGLHGRDFYI